MISDESSLIHVMPLHKDEETVGCDAFIVSVDGRVTGTFRTQERETERVLTSHRESLCFEYNNVGVCGSLASLVQQGVLVY